MALHRRASTKNRRGVPAQYAYADDPKAYRLRFKGTTAKKYAPSQKHALADARYWLSYGQTKVSIDRKMPSGIYVHWRTLRRRKGR